MICKARKVNKNCLNSNDEVFIYFPSRRNTSREQAKNILEGEKYLYSDQFVIRKISKTSRQFQELERFLWVKISRKNFRSRRKKQLKSGCFLFSINL
jgi:hypothetical protein